MFREMRRKKQALPPEETIDILKRGKSGVLAVAGDHDYPYAVPMSYVYHDNKIYFHCAKTGHKIDAIKRNDKVSFCVIDKDQIVSEKYTTYYRSVIVFGRARILEDEGEKRRALEILAAKYSPGQDEGHRLQAIEREFNLVTMIELTIEHMTGKEAIELVRAKGITAG
ncbi:MAG: pyridoxamine 5'-phosphate oxidase family protein [bacterium]|jgi:nitroimidazol reductase NimA-like FMN-containing flavoprotein (pyridoxamine 5'-phosphate oxidase superfamily)|nr:pyridoxamine 5'-phosphate oxidase family protein [Bacillota bacterium]